MTGHLGYDPIKSRIHLGVTYSDDALLSISNSTFSRNGPKMGSNGFKMNYKLVKTSTWNGWAGPQMPTTKNIERQVVSVVFISIV